MHSKLPNSLRRCRKKVSKMRSKMTPKRGRKRGPKRGPKWGRKWGRKWPRKEVEKEVEKGVQKEVENEVEIDAKKRSKKWSKSRSKLTPRRDIRSSAPTFPGRTKRTHLGSLYERLDEEFGPPKHEYVKKGRKTLVRNMKKVSKSCQKLPLKHVDVHTKTHTYTIRTPNVHQTYTHEVQTYTHHFHALSERLDERFVISKRHESCQLWKHVWKI